MHAARCMGRYYIRIFSLPVTELREAKSIVVRRTARGRQCRDAAEPGGEGSSATGFPVPRSPLQYVQRTCSLHLAQDTAARGFYSLTPLLPRSESLSCSFYPWTHQLRMGRGERMWCQDRLARTRCDQGDRVRKKMEYPFEDRGWNCRRGSRKGKYCFP